MRATATLLAGAFCIAATLAGCSGTKSVPAGRWEGVYDASDMMVVVRLEISPGGEIHLRAPSAVDIEKMPETAHAAMRAELVADIAANWPDVQPRPMDFDGRVFRKPGAVAPQMEWNPNTQQMTVVLYLGGRSGVRVPLREVKDFSADPWTG